MITAPRQAIDTLIVGVDVSTREEAIAIFGDLAAAGVRYIKIGPVLMLAMGLSDIQSQLTKHNITQWFLDAKFANTDDILASTADTACNQADFTMLNCMADCGPMALRGFADTCATHGVLSLAVSYLTTKDNDMSIAQHNGRSALEQVLFYATQWIAPAGLDGMVCSAQEASHLRAAGYDGILVCPGIRFAGSVSHDQRRVMTPADAIADGVDYVVMSRDILVDPVPQVQRYIDEVSPVL